MASKKKSSPPLTLNPEQERAVNAGAGYYQIMAGPGSGKTAVIVERYKRLLTEVPAEQVLSLTFTKEAAAEMAKRAGFVKTPGTRPHGFCTFHSLALAFATAEHDSFPFQLAPFPLATEGVANKFIGEAARRQGVEFRRLSSFISEQKRTGTRPYDAVQKLEDAGTDPKIAFAYRDYEDKCRKAGVLDFDSLLMEMVDLLATSKMFGGGELYKRWQYEWLQVDESQDADALQWQLVRLITNTHQNVFAVGDVGQAVYQWRSAMPELFLNFAEMFPGARTLYLAKNHRSTAELVKFYREIGPVPDLAEKFFTENEAGVPPVVTGFPTSVDEADAVAHKIHDDVFSENGTTAVLARTNRALRPIEAALNDAGLKYHLLGRSGFFAQPEIRNVLAFVQLAVAPFDNAVLAAIRSPFACTRFIRKKELIDNLALLKQKSPDTSYYELLSTYGTRDENQQRAIEGLFRTIRSMSTYRGMHASASVPAQNILADIQAVDYYDTEEETPDNAPQENLAELVKIAGRFQTLREFLDYVRKVQAASKQKKGVAVGTVHASKGKEWDTVFVTGAHEGLMPHKNGEPDEEQRIFFVACSRAAKRLYISYAGAPSRFIEKFVQKTEVV